MNKYSYPSINFIEYTDYFKSQRDEYIRESRKFIRGENNDLLTELINNKNAISRTKSNLEQKLENILLEKTYLQNNGSNLTSGKVLSDFDLIIKIRKYFEINNFIYGEYDSSQMQLIKDSEINNIFCLSLLSYILMELYLEYLDFNYLNTALKINDLLQIINPTDDSAKMSYILLVINKEKMIINKLLNK
tara:strand:- start:38 stop:607 length:570 start_codon:yes stop_codon:yes gene_type:complete